MKLWVKWTTFCMVLLLMLSLFGCAKSPAASAQDAYSFTDDLGREVRVSSHSAVAVPASSFADLWTLAGGEVFATSQETFDEGTVTLAEDTVNLGAMKTPSVETMLAQGVDFCIFSSKIAEQVDLEDTLTSAGITVAYFDVETFEDYLRVLKEMTGITGREDLYKQNGEDVQAHVDAAIARKEGHDAPTVLFIRAFSSGAKAKGSDNMTGAMLKDLGCVNIADSESSLLEDVSMEVVIDKDPDFIFVVTMGSSSDAALQNIADTLQSNPAWAELSAVKNDRYVVLPKDLFHLKPNNRWGEAYEMLADILYGKA